MKNLSCSVNIKQTRKRLMLNSTQNSISININRQITRPPDIFSILPALSTIFSLICFQNRFNKTFYVFMDSFRNNFSCNPLTSPTVSCRTWTQNLFAIEGHDIDTYIILLLTCETYWSEAMSRQPCDRCNIGRHHLTDCHVERHNNRPVTT